MFGCMNPTRLSSTEVPATTGGEQGLLLEQREQILGRRSSVRRVAKVAAGVLCAGAAVNCRRPCF